MKKLRLLIMPLMAVSFLASCGNSNIKQYIVYFDTNGGSPEIERQIVKEGNYAKDPKIEIKKGGVPFKFWSLQDEGEPNVTEFVFKDNKITSDITLHAIYPNSSPFAVTCTKGPMTLCLYWSGELVSPSELDVKWSKDKKEWTDVKVTLEGITQKSKIAEFEVDLNTNETIYLAGDNPNGFSFANNSGDIRAINISNDHSDTQSEFEVSGNPLSLVDSTNYDNITEIPPYCFYNLFKNSNVLSAKHLNLSCNQLSDDCYKGMFDRCKKLVEAPNLPAMVLAKECYGDMFYNCGALREAPMLPASTFSENCIECYNQMFAHCSRLVHLRVGFGLNDEWPQITKVVDFTGAWLVGTPSFGFFEWKGSENPKTFERSNGTIPEGWDVVTY